MLRWLAVFALFLLLLTTSASAQGFTALWGYTPDGGAALTTVCNGSTPIPDGRIVRVYWDVDSDGADLTDPVVTVCDAPPLCEEGPPGTFNFNEFQMNGQTEGYGPGYFYTALGLNCVLEMPNPPRLYLRVFETDGINYLWTSAVRVLSPGFQEINLTRDEWTCGFGGPQCTVRDEHE